MVAVSVPQLVSVRPLLDGAAACLDAGNLVGAGVRIRQAARLLLIAFAEACGIKRPLHKFPRPARIARALHRVGRVDAATLESLLELLNSCNAVAHCEDAPAATLRGGVAFLSTLCQASAADDDELPPAIAEPSSVKGGAA